MGVAVSFRGRSGKAWEFQRVDKDGAWARTPGVVIFAAPDAYGWRLIRVMELSGRPHDIQPVWAFAEAERYGASAVFLADEFDKDLRQWIIDDIEAGLSPVCLSTAPKLAARNGKSVRQGGSIAA